MANLIPLAVADFETQLATALEVDDVTFDISSATDDDGVSLPAGKYCFTLDNGKSNKEYLLGQLNGTTITSVKSVSRQGVETTGCNFAHRIGANVVITDFATIQRVADVLRGQLDLDGSAPLSYDAEPTLSDRESLATVGYVLDAAFGGAVTFDNQTTTGTAGEALVAGDLIYFKTSDQEWYKTDADTASTVEGVLLGIALGTGSDGVAITGGVHLSGIYTTTGLTAGSEYYASNTGGAYSTSAGTTSRKIGIALTTTRLFVYQSNPQTITTREKDAIAGAEGTPSTTNKFITEDYITSHKVTRTVYDYAGSPHTWTKDTGLVMVRVQLWGGGGSGSVVGADNQQAPGGGGGAYKENVFIASELGATETITIGAGGAAVSSTTTTVNGNNGGATTFGSLLSATYGGGGTANGNGGAGGYVGHDGGYGGLEGSATTPSGGNAIFGGGGGGCYYNDLAYGGGSSIYGGGGGGGSENQSSDSTGNGGTSIYGGNGGAGAADNASAQTATSGSIPGGGGGGAVSGGGGVYLATSGAGANGRAIVTEYYL